MSMQFNKETIARLAEQARTGPQKQISVDLKRVKKEALFLQSQYELEARSGPVSSFNFLTKWSDKKETKYLCTRVISLARIISQGHFDKGKFDYMMNMGQMVSSGRVREYDASVAIGQKFANEYVAPVAGEAMTQSNTTTSSGSSD